MYPCSSLSECFPYSFVLWPGSYSFELYGASGGINPGSYSAGKVSSVKKLDGESCEYTDDEIIQKWKGNAKCHCEGSNPGAGGYTRGEIVIRNRTQAFLRIGAAGISSNSYKIDGMIEASSSKDEYRPPSSFNGAGRNLYSYYPSKPAANVPSGGGATDLRIEVDDEFHRTLVAGGGGGADDAVGSGGNDGSGGAGGGLAAQSFWVGRVYHPEYEANQTSGFSFFRGEAITTQAKSYSPTGSTLGTNRSGNDKGSGAGGWFGGYSSQNSNGGGGGGSSYALTSTSTIPQGNITVFDDQHHPVASAPYAFKNSSPFCFSGAEFVQGLWEGSGMVRITYSPSLSAPFSKYNQRPKRRLVRLLIFQLWNFLKLC